MWLQCAGSILFAAGIQSVAVATPFPEPNITAAYIFVELVEGFL